MTAIVVLGMHRSGTSCLAGMLAAGGVAAAGDAVRNWDNARGHHERLDAVRLNEAVLAASGGHYLSPPPAIRFDAAHAAARDRLLAEPVDGRPALLKDPRTLLVLDFWRASAVGFDAIGIVRHPLAVARSLEGWRSVPLAAGIALWIAHNRALAADQARHGYPLVDFDRPRAAMIAEVSGACRAFGRRFDADALAAAYDAQLVHHDGDEAPRVPGLAEALALHARLCAAAGTPPSGLAGAGRDRARPRFPRVALAACERALAAGDVDAARAAAERALAGTPDAAAVLVPLVSTFARLRAFAPAEALVAAHADRLEHGLADLLRGKLLLAAGEPARATTHLEAACAVARPFFQARQLLPQALRATGRTAEARAALARVVGEALYPHGPLSTLAEWSWLDGDPAAALAEMAAAIAAAPVHRRGRLRTRRAEWLTASGEPAAARAELEQAVSEDPGYARARERLDALDRRAASVGASGVARRS